MSSFTRPIAIRAKRQPVKGWHRVLPPVSWPALYEVAEPFSYAVGDLDDPDWTITIPAGFQFDGASIPIFARIFLPRVHPQYVQAAAVHDWLYRNALLRNLPRPLSYDRKEADAIFLEAMEVLGTPAFWRRLMWLAVRLGGGRAWQRACRRSRRRNEAKRTADVGR